MDPDLEYKLERLQFYRSECRHEFNLLASRVNWFVTCQSFFLIPFAISMPYGPNWNWLAGCLLPVLGGVTCLSVRSGLLAATVTIDEWLDRQRKLFDEIPEEHGLYDFAISRDKLEVCKDKHHFKSLRFSSQIWAIFLVFWIIAAVLVNDKATLLL